MKRIVMSAVVSLSLAGAAWGQDKTPETYLSVSVGAIFPEDSEHEGLSSAGLSHDIELDDSFAVRGAIGMLWNPFRLELEVGHQSTEVDDVSGRGWVTGAAGGDISILSVMFNGYIDFPVNDWMDIYVGGGIGPAWVEGDLSVSGSLIGTPVVIDLEEDDDVIFAYQAMVGATFHLNEQWALTAGYRMWSGSDPDFSSGSYDTPLIHTGEIGLRFSF